ncbi:MAG: thiol reductase thioredoxin [Myxococcales bacterium]
MAEVPARPKNVPPKAVWNGADGEWALETRNGVAKYWRRDGSLCNECTFKDGKPNGPFKRFHNNGQVSQEGSFLDGELHGTRTWHACDEPTQEQMLTPGMSDRVRRSEMDYEQGRVLAVRHFDAEGTRLTPDGDPYPERPPLVPDEAEFQPDVGWVLATLDVQGRRNGTWQRWTASGELAERTEYVEDVRAGPSTLFHPNGKKAEEGVYAEDLREGVWKSFDSKGAVVAEVRWHGGCRSGPAVDCSVAGQYRDPSITTESGSFEEDHAVGPWSLKDASEHTVIRKDLGPKVDADKLASSPVLANEGKPADEWLLAGEEYLAQKRPAEAILAAARAMACSATVNDFLDIHTLIALPRAAAHAEEIAAEITRTEAPLPVLLNVLLRGASPAPIFRAVAIRLDQEGKPRAALDYVNAAILLEPEKNEYLFTRSLILMSLGLAELAVEDGQARGAADAGEGRFLVSYAGLLFPRFEFWPGREKPQTRYDGLPEAPAQPPAQIRAVFLKYLTRLSILREAQLSFVQQGFAPAWLLPDVGAQLPKGRVKLDEFAFDGGDEQEVSVDEHLAVTGLGLPEIQRLARAEWTAATWLCWACGLEEIALPKTIAPPQDFGQAAGMAVERLWRARDQRVTGGEGARKSKVPGFKWEGMDVDQLHPALVSMCENEYAEMAAMFRWLADAGHRSPWQDNLRDS